jgi:hypothetical protein
MNNNTKLISFIIALKRYRLNSVLLKHKSYKIAPKFNLSTQTFDLYLKECIQLGWIEEKDNHYQIKKFIKIVDDYKEKINFSFRNHSMIKSSKDTNYKKIKKQIEELLILDNVISPQINQINKKRKKISLFNKLSNPTVKKLSSQDYKAVKSFIKNGMSCAGEKINEINFLDSVRTSSRHTSGVTGFSISKSNKLLSNSDIFGREILIKWVHGISKWKIEELKNKFPKAKLILFPSYDKIKVCFGSRMIVLN